MTARQVEKMLRVYSKVLSDHHGCNVTVSARHINEEVIKANTDCPDCNRTHVA